MSTVNIYHQPGSLIRIVNKLEMYVNAHGEGGDAIIKKRNGNCMMINIQKKESEFI